MADQSIKRFLHNIDASKKVLERQELYMSSDDDETSDGKWRLELDWLPKAIEPAFQLSRRALPTEIIAAIQWSKVGVQDWSLSDLTVGLYLIYLRQASSAQIEDVKGIQISSEPILRSCEKQHASRRQHFEISVMRPGYYIGIDTRKRLVILGIRGTHTVYDLVTDIVSSRHEEGFKLKLVGHSLGGAIASLLAIMLWKKSSKELGFSPDIVSAVSFATSPFFNGSPFLQDDIIPRLSLASLERLRNEIAQTDWVNELLSSSLCVCVLAHLGDGVFSKILRRSWSLAGLVPFKLGAGVQGGSSYNVAVENVPAVVSRIPSTSKPAMETEAKGGTRPMPEELCDSHYQALRDVLKCLPSSSDEAIFRQLRSAYIGHIASKAQRIVSFVLG
ncbi:Fungal lipase-like domain [Dillenia turbinata]|uniref:Fungal lipase-like domain n=1 Tax=Dillenia turbinata TaxID=194707 RepID=A0AAN8W2U6_9MAGN